MKKHQINSQRPKPSIKELAEELNEYWNRMRELVDTAPSKKKLLGAIDVISHEMGGVIDDLENRFYTDDNTK